MKKICLLMLVVALVGCTENQRAKKFGGTATENLPVGMKLVNATWRDSNLWILTRPMRNEEVPETYEFVESSAFGIVEGKVVFKESK